VALAHYDRAGVVTVGLTLKVTDEDSPIELSSDSLLVFIDETGEEHFRDPKHPVFGLGGCAVHAADYETAIAAPWRQMKDRLFGGRDSPLHAADLRNPSKEQLDALAAFFSNPGFSRFAAIASRSTEIRDPLPPYQIVATTLMRRVELCATRFSFKTMAMIVESSDRADSLAERHLGPYDKVVIREGAKTLEAPIVHFLLPKYLNEPGLEAADFIIQAVGGHARRKHFGKGSSFGRDFSAIFHAVPRDVVEFINIERVEAIRGEPKFGS
jgi:hypothetical protein